MKKLGVLLTVLFGLFAVSTAWALPWNNGLHIHYDAGGTWADTQNFQEVSSNVWKTSITPVKEKFNFGLQDGDGGWFNCNMECEMQPGTEYPNCFTKNSGNNGWIALEVGKTYEVTISLYDNQNDGSIKFELKQGVVDPPVTEFKKVFLPNSKDGWKQVCEFTTADGVTYINERGDVDGGLEFKLIVDGDWKLPDRDSSGSLDAYISKSGDNYIFADGKYNDVVFTYTLDGKLRIDGTKEGVVIEKPWTGTLLFNYDTGNGWNTVPFVEENGKWIAKDVPFGKEEFEFTLKTQNGAPSEFRAGVTLDNVNTDFEGIFSQNNSNCKGRVGIGTYDVVIVLDEKKTNGSMRFVKEGTPVEGKYAFGNSVSLWFRNDADTTVDFEEVPFKFDAWNAETNPEGLEVFVCEFRANVRVIPFYLKNNNDQTFCNGQTFELGDFFNYIEEGTENNTFTGLVLGEKYRVIIKALPGGAAKDSFIGIFAVNSDYPWGDVDGLRLHSNFENGSWSTVDSDGVNISQGPVMKYNVNTGIWYYDFTAGAPSALSNHAGMTGWEFIFTDNYGIQWYKADQELKYADWQEGGLNVQTADNDQNYYIVASENGVKEGGKYRIQLRKNPATDVWEMRLTEQPVYDGKLYIAGYDTAGKWDYAQATEMEEAVDVNGEVIDNVFIHTMPYTSGVEGEGFQISTATGDSFLNNLYAKRSEGAAVIGTPYAYNEQGARSNWTVAGDNGFITVAVNYNTGEVTVYSPSISVEFVNRKVSKMTGRFDAATYGIPEEQVRNHVEGSSEAHPVVFDRMNHITADINITHRYFDSQCELTIDGATINGLPVKGMAGTSDLRNNLDFIPYAGHLEIDGDGDTSDTYEVVVYYTVTKGDQVKKGEATYSYEPNFQPYFVRPRPVTDADQNLRVRIGFNGNDFKAFVMRTVKIEGNVFETDDRNNPIYHDYRGAGNLDNARVAVYPGFKVEGGNVEAPANGGEHHVPAADHWINVGDFQLTSYTIGGSLDWSSAALLEGKLPVFVNTNCTSATETPEVVYHIYAHYPLYSVGGGVKMNTAANGIAALVDEASAIPRVDNVVRERVHNQAERDSEMTGVEGIAADFSAEGETEYFDLQGIRIANPQQGRIYIMRSNGHVSKIRF